MNSFVRSRSRSGSGGPQELVKPKPAGSPMLRPSLSEDPDSLCVIEERLGSLCDAISKDVVPGLERELSQVRGWLAMLDAQSSGPEGKSPGGTAQPAAASTRPTTTTGDNEQERRKMVARQELEAITTAVEVFKTALGKLYTPRRTGSF